MADDHTTSPECECFGDSGLYASTYDGPNGERLCDLCGKPIRSQPQSPSTSPACPECGWPNGHDWQCKHSTYKNAAWNKPSTSLSDALEKIASGSKRGTETFEQRVRERKGRLTWWAVNVLQDNLAACEGTALATLAAMKSKEQSK